MNILKTLIAALLVLAAVTPSLAKKPDWPGTNGSGVIGFGVLELTPRKIDGKFQSTEFIFSYDIAAKYAGSIQNGQILVMPATALEQFNDIPKSALIAFSSGAAYLPNTDFHMSVKVKIEKPGLYVVAYGPYNGLLTFDEVSTDGRETYKITGQSEKDGQLRWIDQDAGDLTIMNYEAAGIKSAEPLTLRVRLLRDKASILTNKSLFKYESLKLHPKAADRVKLLDANW